MSKKYMMNGTIYNSMMAMAKEIGVDRIYPRNFKKYGITEISEDDTQTNEVNDLNSATTSDGEATYHDVHTRKELIPTTGSFNKKAFVTTVKEDGYPVKYLVSYGGVVAKITESSGVIDEVRHQRHVKVFGTYSSETAKHIKEFLIQNGFEATSIAQIRKDYMF